MRSFDVFFDLRLNKRLSKQSCGWWFATPSRSLWRHCNSDKKISKRNNSILQLALAPSHYLKSIEYGQQITIFIQENVICKMAAIFSVPQCLKQRKEYWIHLLIQYIFDMCLFRNSRDHSFKHFSDTNFIRPAIISIPCHGNLWRYW